MKEPYSTREIDEKFGAIHEKLDTIIDQTTKTNGRVSKLENFRYAVIGALLVISAVVVPLFLQLFQN